MQVPLLRFRDRPISQKLVIIVMVTTATALLLAGAGIVLADSILFRDYLSGDLSTLARIVADNSTGALAFDDSKAAAETLATLRARPHVVGACLYHTDKTILARYAREKTFVCPPPDREEAVRFHRADVTVSRTVVLSGRRIGTLVLVADLGQIGERIRIYGSTVLGVLLASSILAFLLSSRLRGVIATPISRLANAATSVSQTGDYSVRAEKLSGDELGVLVDRFNEMLAGIQSRDHELRKALLEREAALHEADRERRRFRFMAESMPQKIFTATPDGKIDYYNGRWMEFTGIAFEQMKGSNEFVHPDDLESTLGAWKHSIDTGEPFESQHRFRRADGRYRWHLSRAHAMHDDEGRITMWIGSNTDIHEQKEKEEELRRANDNLQQFAYAASHDLQEPIRNVAVYSEIISRRYRDVLDEEGQLFLNFLKEGGRRLATLVNDLLAYTRATMMELSDTPVDTMAVLKNSLACLAEAIRESQAVITFEKLPEVYMGESHLQQVFQNLIANALKYRDSAPPRIHVAAAAQGTVCRLSVQDNGIGIDPEYKEKIFGVFKRLHNDRGYSGTGIGLAICQRVVERYGGRIWVESQPGKGATFFFTIPRRAESVRAAAAQSPPG